MTHRLGALLIIVLLCASCLPVPFDLTVSQSAAVTSRMTQDNPGTITSDYNQSGSQSGFAFSPSVLASGGFDYSAGFVTALDNLSVDIQSVAGGNQNGSMSSQIPNPDPHAPPYLAWPVKSGAPYLFGIVFDAADPTQSRYAMFQGSPFTLINPPFSGLLTFFDAVATMVIGASMGTGPSLSGYDYIHLLSTNGPGSYREWSWQAASTGYANGSQLRASGAFYVLPFIPPGIARVMYYYDENVAADPLRMPNRSFASWYDSSKGTWVSYVWWEQPVGTFFNKRLPIDHRIDALLTTGQLLSTEGGTGRLYDSDGNLLGSFPMGSLAYIGEQYVGGAARAYFSQCLIFNHRLHFNVFWIPTDQMSKLGM